MRSVLIVAGKPVTASGKPVTAAGKPVTAAGKPVTAAGGLIAVSSCMIEEDNADHILRDLAIDSAVIDSVDNTTQITHGASYKTATTNDINHSKPRPPLPNKADRLPSSLVVSPTHSLHNGQGVKYRQAKSSNCEAVTSLCETSIDSCGTSSNDSLSNPSKTSPRRTAYPPTVSLSPSHIRASNSKTKAPIPCSTTEGGCCSLLVPGMIINQFSQLPTTRIITEFESLLKHCNHREEIVLIADCLFCCYSTTLCK